MQASLDEILFVGLEVFLLNCVSDCLAIEEKIQKGLFKGVDAIHWIQFGWKLGCLLEKTLKIGREYLNACTPEGFVLVEFSLELENTFLDSKARLPAGSLCLLFPQTIASTRGYCAVDVAKLADPHLTWGRPCWQCPSRRRKPQGFKCAVS